MYRILPLLCDIGLGILAALGVEWTLGLPFSWAHIGIGLAFAFILDVDVLFDPDLWRDGYVSTHVDSPYDHRDLIHKPFAWLLACAFAYMFVPHEWVLIAGSAVFLHFVHDSMGTGFGITWLWPFSTRSYKFFATKENKYTFRSPLVSWSREELPDVIRRYGVKEWIPLLYFRLTWISGIEYAVFAIGIAALAWRFMQG